MQYVKFFSLLLLSITFLPISAQEQVSVKIDFGNTLSDLPWNNLTGARTGELFNLVDSRGLTTEISIIVSDSFNGINNSGTTAPDPNLGFPGTASSDSFFGNFAEFSDVIEPTAAVTISNLETDREYDLSLFSSRLATDNRETEYILEAATIDTAFLQGSDNADVTVDFSGIFPAVDGTITIRCTAGPNNNNEFDFYYLGALILSFEDEPVVIDPALELVFPNGGEYWQSNKLPEIRWRSQGIDSLTIAFSLDDGLTWNEVDRVSGFTQSYEWNPPQVDNSTARVMVSGGQMSVTSDSFFEISTSDTTECHIVVLGSSTAAGTGPSAQDSAWVWRYQDFIFQNDTRMRVTNLAQGGFTTYNILPTGAEIPAGINQSIIEERNVTMARSLNPNAVIINLPSNDAANNFSVEDQLRNYSFMTDSLDVDSIIYWVATPQPRNNFNDDRIQIQLDMRDSTFSIFQDRAINFWDGFQTVDNGLDASFDSGDGVHMNDAGHMELFLRVLESEIPSFLIDAKTEDIVNSISNELLSQQINVYPNPTQRKLNIKWEEKQIAEVEIYNVQGQLIISQNAMKADSTFKLDVRHLSEGLYYLKIISTDDIILAKSFLKY